jgi:hypothetical protein
LHMMAYGVPADYIDDKLAMAESTSIFYVKHFAKSMVEVLGPRSLRAPNSQDTKGILEMNKARDFSGMLGVHRLHTLEVEDRLVEHSPS